VLLVDFILFYFFFFFFNTVLYKLIIMQTIKCVVVGDGAVGKVSFINNLHHLV
jgi:GTPase SAR1 family protein